MIISYTNNVLTVTPDVEDIDVFNWIFSKPEGNDLFLFTLKQLIDQRKNQMQHDEKEAVYQLYLNSKSTGAPSVQIVVANVVTQEAQISSPQTSQAGKASI